jgi:lipopolysaccharide/colanic/teichoic acid biosynthesis glycosyltransferase
MTVVNGAQVTDKLSRRQRLGHDAPKLLPSPQPTSWLRSKGLFDRAIAAVLLLPGLPIIALLILLVRLTSPGPAIFRQKRVGQGGKVFTMLKLRSMRVDAEHRCGAIWAKDDDPRTTPVGKLLRKFHLDELPQLFNILAGDMSLVGPRPERPEFVSVLSEMIPRYQCRLLVPPGVTGLAQVNLPPDSDLDSVCRKLALDLEYVETGSLWLDLRLIACTASRMFKLGGLHWTGFYHLRRDVDHHPRYLPLPEVTVTSHMSSAALARALGKNGKKNGNGNGNGHSHAHDDSNDITNANAHNKLSETITDQPLDDTQTIPIHRPR